MKIPYALPHFVFGYGSLICPDSRAITAPTVAERDAIPAKVLNLERTWAKLSQRGMTSMGVRFREGAECVGVLVPVTQEELEQFDRREVGYDRVKLSLDDIEKVEYLEEDYSPEHSFLDASPDEKFPEIWVYVQRDPVPATPSHPIVQSYVDIILRGCLSISEEFTDEFVRTTKGWDPEELSDSSDFEDDDDDDDQSVSSTEDSHWIDDRKDPVYVRADVDYSLKKAKELDSFLEKHRPKEFRNRVRKGKSQHRPSKSQKTSAVRKVPTNQ